MELEEVETPVLRSPTQKVGGERASFWPFFGKLLPRLEIVFICQMIVIFVVIAVSLFNLTRGNTYAPDGKFWIALMSSCLGYMLPNPKLG